MDLFVVAAYLLSIAAGSTIGIRLLARAIRSRAFPEAALGTGLFGFAGIAQPCSIAGAALAGSRPDLSVALSVASSVFSAVTVTALFAFTWRVFRTHERWAAALACAGTAIGIAAAAGTSHVAMARLGAATAAAAGPWIALSALAFGLAFGWTGGESLAYWRGVRLRARIGLVDPAVANRFLLWGGGCAVAFALDLVLGVLAFQGVSFTTNAPRLLVSVSCLVNAIVWFLSFMPPAAYSRWIARRAAARG